MGDGSPPAAVLNIATRSPLLPPVVSEYARRDVRCENSEAEDGEDLAHQQVRLLAQLCPSSWTSRWCRWLPSRPSSISWCRLFEKIVTPKLGAWLRMSTTRRTITAGGAVRHLLHVMDLDTVDGVQWPPLVQAIAELVDPPEVPITGAGTHHDLLC
jgi:hypothetical protein